MKALRLKNKPVVIALIAIALTGPAETAFGSGCAACDAPTVTLHFKLQAQLAGTITTTLSGGGEETTHVLTGGSVQLDAQDGLYHVETFGCGEWSASEDVTVHLGEVITWSATWTTDYTNPGYTELDPGYPTPLLMNVSLPEARCLKFFVQIPGSTDFVPYEGGLVTAPESSAPGQPWRFKVETSAPTVEGALACADSSSPLSPGLINAKPREPTFHNSQDLGALCGTMPTTVSGSGTEELSTQESTTRIGRLTVTSDPARGRSGTTAEGMRAVHRFDGGVLAKVDQSRAVRGAGRALYESRSHANSEGGSLLQAPAVRNVETSDAHPQGQGGSSSRSLPDVGTGLVAELESFATGAPESSPPAGVTPGEFLAGSIGSLHMELALGTGLGSLIYETPGIDAGAYTSARLRFDAVAAPLAAYSGPQGEIRQALFLTGLLDVIEVDASRFEVRFFGFEQFHDTGSGFAIDDDNPLQRWIIENPDPTPAGRVRFTGVRDGVTQVHTATWQPAGADDAGRMTLSLFNDSVIEERTYHLDTASASPTRSERITRRRGLAGAVEEDRLVVYGEFYYWGAAGEVFEDVIAEIEDPDGAALATYYGYYDQATQPGGKLSWIIHPDGYWEAYDRFQTTGKLARTYRPWIDDPADPTLADASNCLVTTITYQNPDPSTEVKVEDTIWKNTYRTAYRSTTTTLEADGSVVENVETYLSASAVTLDQTVRQGWHGQTIGTYDSRGALRTFNNVWGYWDPANRTFGFSAGSGRIVAGRTIEIEGTPDAPSGIAGRTTIVLSYSDDRGRVLQEETYVNDGNPFLPGVRTDWISQQSHTYSPDGQLLQTSEDGRVVYEAGYDTDGRLQWSSDELGIRTEFEYDEFGRVFRTVRIAGPSTPDRTTTFEFDATGRVVSQTVEAGTGSEALSETTQYRYDPAGRLILTIAPDGLELAETETMLIGANGSPQRRQVVTTNPDGSQEIVEFYRDRQLFRRYGSAAPAEVWGYGANGIGIASAAFRDLAGTQLRSQRVADWAGNTVLDVLPGFSGQPQFVRTNTYGVSGPFGTVRGLLASSSEPGRATALFEYDELGRTSANGLDLDANGVLDRDGTDPVSISRLAFESTGSPAEWSRVVSTARLETDGSPAETLVSERREKLGPLANGFATSVETLEAGGARFLTEVNVDRATCKRTTTVRDLAASGSAPPTITVEIAGLVRSTRTSEATADTVYDYNALDRLRSVATPLSGTITYVYDSLGRLESTTDSLARETHLTYYTQGQSGAGRVATSRDPAGNTTHFDYDARGRLWRQWGANVYPEQFGYDDDNRLESLRTFRSQDAPAAGGVDWTSPTWPADAPAGDLTQWLYDPSGLLDRKRYADGSEIVYSYDAARRVSTRTNARGQTITHNYNLLGLQESVLYPAGSLTTDCTYLYDRAGRIMSLTDGTGTRTLEHDPETGGVSGESYSAGPLAGVSVVRGFDAFGRQDSLEVPSVFALGWGYDAFNRPERVTGASGTVSGLEVTYVREPGSDRLGNIEWRQSANLRLQSARSYDAISRLTGVTTRDGSGTPLQSHGYTQFDELDRRKRVDREDGKAWNYGYDARGQLTEAAMQDAGGQTIPGREFTFDFDTIGNRSGATQGSLASVYQANALNQYDERTVPGAVRVVGSAEVDTFVTADFVTAARQGEWFSVDIPVDNTAAPAWKQFDVVAVKSGAGPDGEDDVASVARSAFVAKTPEVFAHDPDGNLTSDGRWSYTWDAENRLIAMETKVGVVVPDGPLPESERMRLEFTYDCQSRRIAKKVFSWSGADWALASNSLYLYDGWNVIAEFDALSGLSLARTYAWGLDLSGSNQGAGGVGGLLAVVDANGIHAPWWDGNGNVTGYSNLETGAEEASYTYGPFGETLAATGPLAPTFTHGFSTKFTDPESNLLYYGFRYYSPSTGRWLSRERLGESATVNLYQFLSNCPSARLDVLGLSEVDVHRYLTQFSASNAGFTPDLALKLGRATQALDDPGDPRDAMHGGRNRSNMETFHFPTPQQLAALREKALESCKCSNPDFDVIGEYFHALQDSYPHSQGAEDRDWNYFNTAGGTLPSVHIPQLKIPVVEWKLPGSGEDYGGQEIYGFGHARQGHKPDWTWEYPVKTMKMAQLVFEELKIFAEHCGGGGIVKPWSDIEGTVDRFVRHKPSTFYKERVYVVWVDNVTFEGYDEKIKILDPTWELDPMYRKVRKSTRK